MTKPGHPGPAPSSTPDTQAAPSWPDGVRQVILDQVDSTNAEAARLAQQGERGPLWIVARRQTLGRGRAGRAWTAPEGSLSATYLFAPDCSPADAALYAFTASLAVTGVLTAAGIPQSAGTLKWPNDVLIGRRKVTGILLESSSTTLGRTDWLAIGIGINLVASPESSDIRHEGRQPTNILAEGGMALALEDALRHLAVSMAHYLAIHRKAGFVHGIRPSWLARAYGLGTDIEVDTGNTRLKGRFETVDADGCLVLKNKTGAHRIAAGDVYFPGET